MLKLFDALLADVAATPIDLTPRRYGTVLACDGGLLEMSGLSVPVGSLCRVSHSNGKSLLAEVIGFRNGRTLAMLLGDTVMLRPGARVRPEGRPGMLPVGEAFLGRAVDGEGRPIDGLGPIHARDYHPAGGIRAGALDRSPVRLPFDTGVRALNAITTFGVGQRIGIMAGSGVGKSVLLDMIAHGANAEVIIVGLIGERAREVSDFVERHMIGPKRACTAVIAVPADHAPNLRIRGAMLATSMAEHFRAKGKRVLLIMDLLTRVAHAGREIGLLLGEPGAARGYPLRRWPPSPSWWNARAIPRRAAARSPASTPCWPMATVRTIRSSIRRVRSSMVISCSAAIWRSAGNIPPSTLPPRSRA